uniref:Uncharacterized protein n=1 Tax=Rhizophora mucronata TaxID=61149 RepID=A0A2P2QMJ7_RHIMU
MTRIVFLASSQDKYGITKCQ